MTIPFRQTRSPNSNRGSETLDVAVPATNEQNMSRPGRLDICHVSKRYLVAGRPVPALADINLSVAPGEFTSIVGASGCGKSTLLRLLAGLEPDYDGEIRIAGSRIAGVSFDRAIVFQERHLIPSLTVEANVGLGLLGSGLSVAAKRRAVHDRLELLGLGGFAQAYPGQLSAGMAQRIALARALVTRPRILLLDEPLGVFDVLTRARLQDELRRIVRHEGMTTVLVTHDVDEAVYLGNRIVVMRPHPGRIVGIVPVPLAYPRNRSDPAFIRIRDRVLGVLGAEEGVAPIPAATPAVSLVPQRIAS